MTCQARPGIEPLGISHLSIPLVAEQWSRVWSFNFTIARLDPINRSWRKVRLVRSFNLPVTFAC